MFRLVLAVFVIALLAVPAFAQEQPSWVPGMLYADEAAEGFFPLFNGKDLDGMWISGENKEAFKAEEGKLVVTGQKGGGWIFTDGVYENFVLRYEYRIPNLDGESIGNSGVGIRAAAEGNPAFSGMEIQVIQPDWEVDWQSTGALYATVPPKVNAENPVGEWNRMEVLCDGPRIRTILNGQELYDIQMTDYTKEKVGNHEWMKPLDDRVNKGHVAFQSHGNHVEFRRMRLKPLPGGEGWKPLWNGKNLDGWEVLFDPLWSVEEEKGSTFLRVDGTKMQNRERHGLKTTREDIGDFELQLMFRPHGNSNSGVFFRGGGDDPWPRTYEAQIHNYDAKQFTGAIWNQVQASELHAVDNRWNHMHISARGDKIDIWVNGKKVVDYTSPADRHAKYPQGWITLQGHDPMSVVDFKDIQILE
jgi:hypothetical protein